MTKISVTVTNYTLISKVFNVYGNRKCEFDTTGGVLDTVTNVDRQWDIIHLTVSHITNVVYTAWSNIFTKCCDIAYNNLFLLMTYQHQNVI